MAASALATTPASTNVQPALAFTVLAHESQAEFDRTLAALRAEHQPLSQHQAFLVHQLAVNQWLLTRSQRLESKALDHLAGADPNPADPESRIVTRLFETNPKTLISLQRSAMHAEKSYYRAVRELEKTKRTQIEPTPAQAAFRPQAQPVNRPAPPKQNEPNPRPAAFNPALANPSKPKLSLREQMPANLALCL